MGLLFALPIFWLLVSTCCQFCTTSYYQSLFEDMYEEETIRSTEEGMQEIVKTESKKKCIKILKVLTTNTVDWKKLSNQLIDLIMKRNLNQNLPQQDQDPPLPV